MPCLNIDIKEEINPQFYRSIIFKHAKQESPKPYQYVCTYKYFECSINNQVDGVVKD